MHDTNGRRAPAGFFVLLGSAGERIPRWKRAPRAPAKGTGNRSTAHCESIVGVARVVWLYRHEAIGRCCCTHARHSSSNARYRPSLLSLSATTRVLLSSPHLRSSFFSDRLLWLIEGVRA